MQCVHTVLQSRPPSMSWLAKWPLAVPGAAQVSLCTPRSVPALKHELVCDEGDHRGDHGDGRRRRGVLAAHDAVAGDRQRAAAGGQPVVALRVGGGCVRGRSAGARCVYSGAGSGRARAAVSVGRKQPRRRAGGRRAAPPLPLPPRLWALTVAMRSTALLKEGLAAAEEARELCVPLLPPCGAPPGPASARTRNAARPAAGRAQRDTEELWRRPVAAVGARASMAKGCRVFGGFAESGSLGREGAVRAGGETGNGMHGCKWFCRSDAASPGRADLSARGGRRAGAMLARFRLRADLAPCHCTRARAARPRSHTIR